MTRPGLCSLLSVVLLAFATIACQDDNLYDPSFIGNGEAEVTAEVTFTPLTPALTRAQVEGGTSGEAVKEIKTICVVVYNDKGELHKNYYFTEGKFKVEENKDVPSDYLDRSGTDYIRKDDPHQAEEKTRKATFTLPEKLPYGTYRIYAVANVPQEKLTNDVLSSAEKLKSLQLEWNDDIAENNQMFGYFSKENTGNGFDAPTYVVNQPYMKLHAWVRRLVSKVTVAFDGSGLKEGVKIYIKSIAIRDIPNACLLGANNKPDDADMLIGEGQTFVFNNDKDEYTSADYTDQWLGFVSKQHPINGCDQSVVSDANLDNAKKLEQLHSETANAFYLFENMQGRGEENTPSDKRQLIPNHIGSTTPSFPDGTDPTNIAWKDAKYYGSYIEVKAYYKSNNTEEGEGDIVYRFMLGKNTVTDYDTERNHHFKLTLKFKGWANDVDWHIDYKKKSNILRFPRPFYISYLYGQTTMIPIEFDVPENLTIKSVQAGITENNWTPTNGTNAITISGNTTPQETTIRQWNNTYYFYVSNSNLNQPYNGFLSLRKPQNLFRVMGDKNNDIKNNKGEVTTERWTYDENKNHFETYNLGNIIYNGKDVEESNFTIHEAMEESKLHVSRVGTTYYVKIPIWTRARNLVKETGYTGNNPYNSNYRDANVHVEVVLSNGQKLQTGTTTGGENIENINVRQVRRLTNPKGIWRSKGCALPFHVSLKVLETNTDTEFTDLKSDGTWRAYVMYDTDQASGKAPFVSLEIEPDDQKSTYGETTFLYEGNTLTRRSIEGQDKTPMRFNVKFAGPNPSDKPRYAVIRVEYNYNSCYHLIFVRQGYEADDTFSNGLKWCTANNKSQNELADNPLDEGSLFRFGHWDSNIPSHKNVNGSGFPAVSVSPADFAKNAYTENWGNLSNKTSSEAFDSPGGNRRIATYEDYMKFLPKDFNNANEVENHPIKMGYGVLYGDESTETASTMEKAFGYLSPNKTQGYGMRGVFVYDKHNGKNLFFPIGNSGFGHRKHSLTNPNSNTTYNGVLRYASSGRWGYFDVNPYRTNINIPLSKQSKKQTEYTDGLFTAPLFLDIFRAKGAIYWYDKAVGNEIGWDINYSTFDFNTISIPNVFSGNFSDACFIRCIEN